MNNAAPNLIPLSPPAALSPSNPCEGLLKSGERPMGVALDILVRATAAAEVDPDGWCVMSPRERLAMTTALRALSKSTLNPSLMGKLTECFTELAVFLPADLTLKWERQGAWRERLAGYHRDEYDAYVTGSTPSVIYAIAHAGSHSVFHQAFQILLETLPLERLRQVLSESADRIDAWAVRQPGYSPRINAVLAGQEAAVGMGLPPEMGMASGLLEVLADQAPLEKTWIYLLHYGCSGQPARLLEAWGEALGFQGLYWSSLSQPGSVWVSLGLLIDAPHGLHVSEWDIRGDMGHWPSIWSVWSCQRQYRERFSLPGGLLSSVAQPFQAEPATWTLPDWTRQWSKALQQSAPVRLLLCGSLEQGAEGVIATLLAKANRQGWVPPSHYVSLLRQNPGLKERHVIEKQLFSDITRLSERPHSVLIAHPWSEWLTSKGESEKPDLALKVLTGSSLSQIWIVSSLSNVPEEIRVLFHDIRELKEPSLSDRQIMAKQWFPESLSLRVARAISSPNRMKALSEWCNYAGVSDWSEMIERISIEEKEVFGKKETALTKKLISLDRPKLEGLPPLAGYPAAFEFLRRTVDVFANPEPYIHLGARMPRGAMLIGQPGCGKTLLARHLAARVDIPLLIVDTALASEDVGALGEIFREARLRAPCVLFFDEADVLMANPLTLGGTDTKKQRIVNTLLAELDGVNPIEGVFVIAATHRFKNLEPALFRSGRLSDMVMMDLPGPTDRHDIWKAHLATRKVANDIDAACLAHVTKGFTGADIDEALNKAALHSAQAGARVIDLATLTATCNEVYWGPPNDGMYVIPEDRWVTAVHEAGHAIVAWGRGLEVPRLTVRPRRHALGMTQWQRMEGLHCLPRTEQMSHAALALGGLAAEKMVFGHFGTGGTSDLSHVESLISCVRESGQDGLTLSWHSEPSYWSDRRRQAVEDKGDHLIEEAMKMATACLEAAGENLTRFAQAVFEAREMSSESLSVWSKKFLPQTNAPKAFSGVPKIQPSLDARPTLHHDSARREREDSCEG